MAESQVKSKIGQSKRIIALKGHITRICNRINKIIIDDEADIEEISNLKDTVEERRELFVNEIFTYLETYAGEDEVEVKEREEEIKLMDDKLDKVYDAIDRYMIDLKKPSKYTKVQEFDQGQLERIPVAKFSGKDYFQWKPIYDATIGSQNWPDKTKLIRLISCLEGEPRELLKSYPIEDESYKVCLSRLDDTYGGTTRRIAEAIRKVRSGRQVDEENLADVRRFLTTLEATEVALRGSGENSTSNGALYQCAKERLSPSLLRSYARWTVESAVSESFQSLITFLSNWSKIVESSAHKIKRPPMMSHAQDLTPTSTNRPTQQKSDCQSYAPICLWHQKKKGKSDRHYLDACVGFKALTIKERTDFVYLNRLCKICFKKNHMANSCKNKRSMCRKCKPGQNNHHYLLHETKDDIQNVMAIEVDAPIENNDVLENNNCQLRAQVSLQTVPLYVRNGEKILKVNAMLDSGSSHSFVSQDVVRALGLAEYDHDVRAINTITKTNEKIKVAKVHLRIESLDGKCKRTENILSVPNILMHSLPVEWQKYKERWSHLKAIKFPQLANKNHEMLIGSDLPYFHRNIKEIRGGSHSPVAKLTPLGWCCMGPLTPNASNWKTSPLTCCQLDLGIDPEEVTNLWRLDSLGIQEPANEKYLPTEEERLADNILKERLVYKEGRYEAPILWRGSIPDKNNFDEVYKRTKAMEKKLEAKGVMKNCTDVMLAYEKKGYIEEIPFSRRYEDSLYLPYFPIIKTDRQTTKTRLVYDAKAKFNGLSLNDRILTGSKLQNDILDILIRFRQNEFALVADISEMFLQISLAPEDRRFCRFITQNKIYEWKRTLFGRTDSPHIANAVVKTNASKFLGRFPRAVELVLHNMYVDDLVISVQSRQEASDLVHQIIAIFDFAGMKIQKWNTNNQPILNSIPEELKVHGSKQFDKESPKSKILGIGWDSDRDVLSFSVEFEDQTEKPCTKRSILKTVARVFDVAGYISPFLIKAKILLQRAWTESRSWDEPLSKQLQQEWLSWCQQIKEISQITIPRYIGLQAGQKFQLHVFSDASKEVYAACIYMKMGENVKLLLSKARVTPLKAQSIVRLELVAATLAVRIAKKTCDALNISIRTLTFWVDAVDVLYWLKRPAKYFKPFVANRVSEIQSLTNPGQWRYIPTKLNAADIPTRCRTVQELLHEDLWWEGPEFLKQDQAFWPPDIVTDVTTERGLTENAPTLHVCNVEMDPQFPLDVRRWSNLGRLKRRLAYVLRFIDRSRGIAAVMRNDRVELIPTEYERAEKVLVKMCQAQGFSEELESLTRGKMLPKNSKILKLNPFVDKEGLMRAKSRLQFIEWLDWEFRCPLIVPKQSSFTWLLVKDAHERFEHTLGSNAALNELNKRFWIIGARVILKRVKSQCNKCRIQRAKAHQPAMAPIPEYRLEKPLQVFTRISVDFAGPFFTKKGRGQARNKRYLVLFTCLQTRAVHLEMVYSLETSSFLNAFVRMTERRGIPITVVSDNGRTFVKAEKEIRARMLSDQRKLSGAFRQIEWKFLPPYASNFAGVHEILIKAAKRALHQVMSLADVNDEELETGFVTVEGLLNSRPISKPGDECTDDLCLTPNHFLVGRLNPGNVLEGSEEASELRPQKRWQLVQTLVDHFWSRWTKEILHGYRTRVKWLQAQPNLKVDDVVIVLDPVSGTKRTWRLGRVLKTYPGRDSVVRVVDVRTDGKIYRRPANKLCLLEG